MARPKRNAQPSSLPRAFLMPVVWIVALVASYWVLADWQTLPSVISNALAAI